MSRAYVDTSCLLAVTFDEPGGSHSAEILESYSDLVSSDLLEAELLSALKREGVEGKPEILESIGWILPERPLRAEIERVLEHGLLRGADVWHLASALYAVEDPGKLPFLTFDRQQESIASSLGFPTPLAHIGL